MGVFCISLTLLLGELLLTRIFSVIFMYHFAFLVISLALFGLGVGGIAVYLYPKRFGGDLQRRLVTQTLIFTASMVFLVLFLFNLPLTPSSSLRGTLTIALVYVVSAVPFFVGGTCLSLLLSRSGQEVNRIYFFDLLGAGASCLLIIPALNYLGGVTSLLTASAGAALAALMFAWPRPRVAPVRDDAGQLLQRTLTVLVTAFAAATIAVLVAEPVAAWVGEYLFASHPVYSKRPQPFSYYFDAQIRPEIRAISASTRWPLIVALAASAGTLFWVRRARSRAAGRAWLMREELRLAAGAALLAVVGIVVVNASTDAIRIRFSKGRVEFQNLYEGWNSFSRIAVLPRRGDNTYAWGLSPSYDGPPGEQLALDIDSLAGTPLVKFDGDIHGEDIRHLSHDITALAYELRPARTTLVIGPGGGRDVLTALKYGSKDIEAVELNPLMKEVVNERFGDFTGRLYERPEVHLTIDDGRHFVRETSKRFGVVQLSLVDTWASTAAGAFALSENTLYTVEAFDDYLNKLDADGVLTVSRWLSDTPRESLRVVSLARTALRWRGVDDASGHIIVAGTPPLRRDHRFASVIIGLRPFTPEEIAKARQFAAANGFEVLYSPGDPRDPVFSEFITTPELDRVMANYEIDVTPTTDDRPFFFNTVWPSEFLNLWDEQPGRMGVHLLARLLLIVVGLVLSFIIVPLYLRRRSALANLDSRARWSTLIYFAALGSGFMLIEIALISKFILFLGHPIYALTAVLCTILISAGIGSHWSGRHIGSDHDSLRRVIAVALGGIVVLSFLIEVVYPRFLVGAPFVVCVLLTVAALAPVAFLMGMPFPLGLRLLDRVGPQWAELIPWVWGINGATSVLGSILAITIAINFGFRTAMAVGLCAYGLAMLTARSLAGGAQSEAVAATPATRHAARG
jgi:predicted membrane-bound spermidine synthase